MLRKAIAWLFDQAAQAVVGAVLGCAVVAAAAHAVFRKITDAPASEWTPLVVSSMALVAYAALVRTSAQWLHLLNRHSAAPDPLDEANRRRIRTESGQQLRSVYHGSGSRALGGALQEVERTIHVLRVGAADGKADVVVAALADASKTLHDAVDRLLKHQECRDDVQFNQYLEEWSRVFERYQMLVWMLTKTRVAFELDARQNLEKDYVRWRKADAELLGSLRRLQYLDGCERLIGGFRIDTWSDEARPPLTQIAD